MTTYFPTLSVDEQANTLARLLPDGPLFDAKWRDQTIMRKLLLGLAGEFARLDGTMADVLAEFDPRTTNLFLEEWERAVAIPGHCFDGKGGVDLRRLAIAAKLSHINVQTRQDFIDLALLFGFAVEIESGANCGVFPLPFPVCFFDSYKEAKHTMIVRFPEAEDVFPLAFPLQFSSGVMNIVVCLFNQLRPANVNVRYEFAA
jgi:uncharacterized protein YmfQ (DUF2313 family)